MTPYEQLLDAAPRAGAWFHSIEVAPGVWTNGLKSRAVMEHELSVWDFPADLTGKTVLDIGCADGGWSIAALRRGARSVLAIDEQMTSGIRLITASGLFPGLEYRQVDLFSDAFMALPKFDFVIFTGVLYHVHDMLETLKRVRARTDGQVLLETHVNESAGSSPPLAIYYETNELNDDRTNWWGPNILCLEAMLRTCGFAYDRSYLVWGGEEHENGRIAYQLQAVAGAIAGDVVSSATGSNPHLEWASGHIEKLSAENADLRLQVADAHTQIVITRQQVADIRGSTSWRVTAPLRALAGLLGKRDQSAS
jgi:tRNA (mo5U34)-methyltransferase